MKKIFIFNKSTRINFGKWKGARLKNVLKKDPRYLRWALGHVKWFVTDQSLSKEIYKKAQERDWEAAEAWNNNYQFDRETDAELADAYGLYEKGT